jgi:hypothetical protein
VLAVDNNGGEVLLAVGIIYLWEIHGRILEDSDISAIPLTQQF